MVGTRQGRVYEGQEGRGVATILGRSPLINELRQTALMSAQSKAEKAEADAKAKEEREKKMRDWNINMGHEWTKQMSDKAQRDVYEPMSTFMNPSTEYNYDEEQRIIKNQKTLKAQNDYLTQTSKDVQKLIDKYNTNPAKYDAASFDEALAITEKDIDTIFDSGLTVKSLKLAKPSKTLVDNLNDMTEGFEGGTKEWKLHVNNILSDPNSTELVEDMKDVYEQKHGRKASPRELRDFVVESGLNMIKEEDNFNYNDNYNAFIKGAPSFAAKREYGTDTADGFSYKLDTEGLEDYLNNLSLQPNGKRMIQEAGGGDYMVGYNKLLNDLKSRQKKDTKHSKRRSAREIERDEAFMESADDWVSDFISGNDDRVRHATAKMKDQPGTIFKEFQGMKNSWISKAYPIGHTHVYVEVTVPAEQDKLGNELRPATTKNVTLDLRQQETMQMLKDAYLKGVKNDKGELPYQKWTDDYMNYDKTEEPTEGENLLNDLYGG